MCIFYTFLFWNSQKTIHCIDLLYVNISYSRPQVHLDVNLHGLCMRKVKLVNFQSHYDFRECSLYCVYREPVWWRESLQRRKAFEKLLPVSSPPLHCTFVSLSPLTPSFSLSLPIMPVVAYKVSVFLCWAAGLCGFMIFFWVPLLHSGVTLFHSSTQGITSLKGIVGSCTETVQSSTVWGDTLCC